MIVNATLQKSQKNFNRFLRRRKRLSAIILKEEKIIQKKEQSKSVMKDIFLSEVQL